MITIRKLKTLKERTMLRKASGIFRAAAVTYVDRGYLSDVLSLVLSGDIPNSEEKERIVSYFSEGKPSSYSDISFLLLDILGESMADWDFFDGEGNVNWGERNVFEHYLFLDHVRSPYNVGSVFRSAEAFGVKGIFIARGGALPSHARALRTAMGTVDAIEWKECSVSDIPDLPVFALEKGGTPISSFGFPEKGICVIGSEEEGITPEAREKAESSLGIVTIEQFGVKGSINLSAATAIMLHRWSAFH